MKEHMHATTGRCLAVERQPKLSRPICAVFRMKIDESQEVTGCAFRRKSAGGLKRHKSGSPLVGHGAQCVNGSLGSFGIGRASGLNVTSLWGSPQRAHLSKEIVSMNLTSMPSLPARATSRA